MTGSQLRAIRLRLGWTQAALAEALGVRSNTVARYERDERAIPEPVARLAKRLEEDTMYSYGVYKGKGNRPWFGGKLKNGEPVAAGLGVWAGNWARTKKQAQLFAEHEKLLDHEFNKLLDN